MGEVPPDQQGRSDRQFTREPAVGCLIGKVRSRGPKRTLHPKMCALALGCVHGTGRSLRVVIVRAFLAGLAVRGVGFMTGPRSLEELVA